MHATIGIPNRCGLLLPLLIATIATKGTSKFYKNKLIWLNSETKQALHVWWTPLHCQYAPNSMCRPPHSPSNVHQLLWCIKERSWRHMVWYWKISATHCLACSLPTVHTRQCGAIWQPKRNNLKLGPRNAGPHLAIDGAWAFCQLGTHTCCMLVWQHINSGLGLKTASFQSQTSSRNSFGYCHYKSYFAKYHCSWCFMWLACQIAWLTLCQDHSRLFLTQKISSPNSIYGSPSHRMAPGLHSNFCQKHLDVSSCCCQQWHQYWRHGVDSSYNQGIISGSTGITSFQLVSELGCARTNLGHPSFC